MSILATENSRSLRHTKEGILLSTSIFIQMTCAKVKHHPPPLRELDELRLSVTCSGLHSGTHMELSFLLWWCFEMPAWIP